MFCERFQPQLGWWSHLAWIFVGFKPWITSNRPWSKPASCLSLKTLGLLIIQHSCWKWQFTIGFCPKKWINMLVFHGYINLPKGTWTNALQTLPWRPCMFFPEDDMIYGHQFVSIQTCRYSAVHRQQNMFPCGYMYTLVKTIIKDPQTTINGWYKLFPKGWFINYLFSSH